MLDPDPFHEDHDKIRSDRPILRFLMTGLGSDRPSRQTSIWEKCFLDNLDRNLQPTSMKIAYAMTHWSLTFSWDTTVGLWKGKSHIIWTVKLIESNLCPPQVRPYTGIGRARKKAVHHCCVSMEHDTSRSEDWSLCLNSEAASTELQQNNIC